ncbi:MAG TPA: hypothetical protein VF545_05465 [Thermoleophilaceae bacterium]
MDSRARPGGWATAAALLAAAVVTVTGCGDSDAGSEPKRRTGAQTAPPVRKARGVTRDQAAVTGELLRPQTTSDKVPLEIARKLADGGQYGVNVEFARRAARVGRADIWLAPGDRAICLIATDLRGIKGGFSVDCQPPAKVATGNLYVTLISGRDPEVGQTTVFGVVPDGVPRVTVTDDDGSRRVVPVSRNVYAARGGRARWVEFDTRAGHQRTRV